MGAANRYHLKTMKEVKPRVRHHRFLHGRTRRLHDRMGGRNPVVRSHRAILRRRDREVAAARRQAANRIRRRSQGDSCWRSLAARTRSFPITEVDEFRDALKKAGKPAEVVFSTTDGRSRFHVRPIVRRSIRCIRKRRGHGLLRSSRSTLG